MATAKRKAKRYTPAEKQKILGFIEAQGRGGTTAAVKKFKVTAATIIAWKKKAGGEVGNGATPKAKATVTGSTKERKAIQELSNLLTEIEVAEKALAKLHKRYAAAKAKL